jgi:hypothetical protein
VLKDTSCRASINFNFNLYDLCGDPHDLSTNHSRTNNDHTGTHDDELGSAYNYGTDCR